MAAQPSYRPLRESTFFADRRASRPLVEGTIPRGSKTETGFKIWQAPDVARLAGIVASARVSPLAAGAMTANVEIYVSAFPEPNTFAILERGRQRFDIFCAVCHDRVGTGQGMIVQRGFTPPPSFHTDLSRGFRLKGSAVKLTDAPVGYFFEVITKGFGAMPDYASQVEPKDRWAIIAYIRALQFSQNARLEDVADAAERTRLESTRGEKP